MSETGEAPSARELCKLSLFQDVEAAVLDWIVGSCRIVELRPGDVLLTPQHANHALYVLLEGRLQVRVGTTEPPLLTSLTAGACVGEMSVLERMPPSATVTAETDSRVLELHEDFLWLLINRQPLIARNLLAILSARLRADNYTLMESLQQQRVFEQNAKIDTLTNLHNRRALHESLNAMLARCQGGERTLSVIMVDVDHFKHYNDRHGHLAGDHALIAVANTIRSHLRTGDDAARFGGEEFVVLLPDTPLDDALAIAERLRKAVSRKRIARSNGPSLPPITVSVGVANCADADTAEGLLAAADAALYRAKNAGRNRVCA
ncbi:MAG: GGDEF domain-containing protein [Gammaproteobacteria bacterium]